MSHLGSTDTVTVTTTSTVSNTQTSVTTMTVGSEITASTTAIDIQLVSTTATVVSTVETVLVEIQTIPTTIVETSTAIATITDIQTITTVDVATAEETQYATVYARDAPMGKRGSLDEVIVGSVDAAIKSEYELECVSTQGFLSACACNGIPTSTTTIPGSTATTTTIVTATATVTQSAVVTETMIQPVTDVEILTETTTVINTLTEQTTMVNTVTTSTTTTNSYFTTIVVTSTATDSAVSVVTLSSTTTVAAAATTTLSAGGCDNEGVQWALWSNPYGDATQQSYSSFVAESFKSETPLTSGTTSIIGGFSSSGGKTMTVYGSSYSFSDYYFVLDHRFYLYATQTGSYTFAITNVDDLGMIWLGSTAYSGWTRQNDLVDTQDMTQSGVVTYSVTAGQYLPVRLMMAQAQGGAALTFTITAHDGTTVLSSSTGYSKNILQFSCDQTSAPVFPPWGNES
jgi:hypothetical protein